MPFNKTSTKKPDAMQQGTGTTQSFRGKTKSAPSFRPWPGLRPWFLSGGILLAGLAVLSGCAALGKRLEPPRISLTQIEMESATVFEMVMQVTLRIFNTNEVPLTLKGADIRLEINGKDFARGVSQIEAAVPAYGTALVPMTLYSSTIDMVQGIVKMKDRDALKYRVYGNVRIDGGFLLPSSLPFSSEGELSMDRIRPDS
jgi:LEA14-like dessication related protein